MHKRVLRPVAPLLLSLALALPGAASDLIVVQRPVESSTETPWNPCVSGSRIIRIGADGSEQVLTEGLDGACDPSVSFDATEILFAARRAPDDPWRIWKMGADGSGKQPLPETPEGARAPLWIGAVFHLNDDAPTDRFAFLATDPDVPDRAFLHTAELDGGHLIRISFNPDGDLPADVLTNGRLVYPSWRPQTNPELGSRLAIMGLNIDGTDLMAFADPHGTPPHPHAVRVGHDQRVYFVESSSDSLEGGTLSFVTLRRPLRSRTVLAPGNYLDPAPLVDGGLLVSRRAEDDGPFALVRIDPQTGAVLGTVIASPDHHVLDAQELAPREKVRGRSTVVDLEKSTGVFFCISSHLTDRPELAHLRDGGATRLRVIENQSPALERVLGEAPVEPDGSFHIEVPAQIPLRFQLLDDTDRVIGEQRSWTWVMPREWRGCIGCHEDREMVAPNILADAFVKPAVRLGDASSDTKEGHAP